MWQFSKKQNMETWKHALFFIYYLFIIIFSTKVLHLALNILNLFYDWHDFFYCERNHTFHSTYKSRYIKYCKKKSPFLCLFNFIFFFSWTVAYFIAFVYFIFLLAKCHFEYLNVKYIIKYFRPYISYNKTYIIAIVLIFYFQLKFFLYTI